jgi:hypothetical protein
MFRKGDVVRFKGADGYAAKFGALAIVSHQSNNDDWNVVVEWLEITSHLSNGQMNGGYQSSSFELISKGEFDKESILIEIENELNWLDLDNIRERFMNLLGGMEINRLENILDDIIKDVDKEVIRDKSY